MKKISEKLRKQAIEESRSFIEQLVMEGADRNAIVQAIKRHVEGKMNAYYHNTSGLGRINNVFDGLELEADSKAEMIFYDLLQKNKVDFKFHYKIGPYTVDYFIPEDLVIELDGPQHDKDKDEHRDNYLSSLGYRILRLPLWVVANDPQAVINEIQAA